ncbi:cell division protein FtsZ [Halothiobacillus diazotrophicus]|uniref:Cell division protein FtsZ n=1 Tax=Halothiobacillus diazotrophicus TaxID=1860122 RepID=A0A191ZJC5_9GAMM|nr:cell division protein FtsZ [Halothiobacillus diazotrophicus]ANJ67947.1 cell division protein FtsZ [Halothiobacillus diazotrophicus]
MTWKMLETQGESAKIKVIGVGGGGGNAVAHMLSRELEGIEYICANTDSQALRKSQAQAQLQIGGNITKGLGAGADPELGRQAALEDREQIQEAIKDANMLFITTGMGGGTGTGAAPVIAQIAKDMNILTVAVVTRPFSFEGKKRTKTAMEGIEELEKHVDSLIVIPNDKLTAVMGKGASLRDAFSAANEVLFTAVSGISELITRPGEINLDFADVRAIMTERGTAMMGTGIGRGDNRAAEAAEAAIHSPLLDDISLTGAEGILVNVASNGDLSIGEFMEIGELVQALAGDEALVKVGTAIDETLEGELRVTLVATGLVRHPVMVDVDQRKPRVVVHNEAPRQAIPEVEATQEPLHRQPVVTMRGNTAVNLDVIDIPSFLRKQAD